MPDAAAWPIAIACAYLIGAIPFGLLVARARGIDIRAHGSGNIGATNVTRVLGKRLGRIVFLLDFAKGALPVLITGLALGPLARHAAPLAPPVALAWTAVAVAAILGHIFPVYLRFKGGKGVATTFGALLALWPFVTLACALAMLTWVITLKLTRYVSVSSCAAAIALPLGVLLAAASGITTSAPGLEGIAQAWPFAAATALVAALVIARHRANLARVRAGTEPKVGRPKPLPT